MLSKHILGFKQLTLVDLDFNDYGQYLCSWTRGGVRFEAYAIVWIFSPSYFAVFGYFSEFGRVSPSWIEVSQNSSVTLTCYSTIRVYWHGFHFQSLKKKFQNNTVTLYNLQKEHSGEYICRGGHNFSIDGHFIMFHARARIIVDGDITRIDSFRRYM